MKTRPVDESASSRKVLVPISYFLACIFTTVGSVFIMGCTSVKPNTSVDVSKEYVLRMVSAENIRWVKVYYYPENAALSSAMQESDLECQYFGSVTIRDYQFSKFRSDVIDALKKSTFEINERESRDLRWGCVFYDGYGNRLLSLYFTAGRGGVVNNTGVYTDGKFVEFLRSEFDCIKKMCEVQLP